MAEVVGVVGRLLMEVVAEVGRDPHRQAVAAAAGVLMSQEEEVEALLFPEAGHQQP